VLATLLVLVAFSSVAHLWALHRDLPLQEPDESAFVRPAVRIAATGDLNPDWFGHPGSTVIYPVAGFIRGWETIAHGGPIIGEDSELTARFNDDPTSFYVIGRLWTIALSVGAIPLLFLVGRRAFNTKVALIATALWVMLPDPVHFGRIVRSDSAAVFFGLLALWLCLRVLDDGRARWCVLAGFAVGLAVASRYFMLALVPVLLVAAILPHRATARSAMRAAGIASASAFGGFVLSTPYFFLDWNSAWGSLQNENEPMLGRGGLSPLGNLRWYLGTAIPAALTWALVAFALLGIVIVVRRGRPSQLLLLLFGATFLAGICASKLHWQRWVIEILPVIVLFAGAAVDVVASRLAAVAGRLRRAPLLKPAVLVAITAALAIQPASELAAVNRRDTRTSTSAAALRWIEKHVEPGSRVLVDPSTLITQNHTDVAIDDRFSPSTDTLADYRRDDYDYLVINGFKAGQYSAQPDRYPHETAFYAEIGCSARLDALFQTSATRRGAGVRIYRLDEPAAPEVASFCAPPR
jgi:4-amino-4-deoxy-L-arabinose transferase-like glycosyltransferase